MHTTLLIKISLNLNYEEGDNGPCMVAMETCFPSNGPYPGNRNMWPRDILVYLDRGHQIWHLMPEFHMIFCGHTYKHKTNINKWSKKILYTSWNKRSSKSPIECMEKIEENDSIPSMP